MLRLFRHIRQRLFLEGKVSRYIGYALGEIVLIVVGILLAFQISEWNQARKDSARRDQYIGRLIKDVEQDIETFNKVLSSAELRRNFADLVIQAVDDPSIVQRQPVEFLVAIEQSGWTRVPVVNSDTFEQLRTTGHLELFGDDLTTALLNYYRTMEQKRQFDQSRESIKFKHYELTEKVLSNEQKVWLQDEVGPTTPVTLELLKSLPVNKSAVLETLNKLRENEETVGWLTRVRYNQTLFIWENNASIDTAKNLLDILISTQKDFKK
jgi:hypothetical protein